jgi:hypothetical protein
MFLHSLLEVTRRNRQQTWACVSTDCFMLVSCLAYSSALKMGAICSSETSAFIIIHGLMGSSRYSDWLRAERPRGRSSSPGRVKNFLFSTSSSLALGSTQLLNQWVSGALSRGQSGRGLKLMLRSRMVELYLHTPHRSYWFGA